MEALAAIAYAVVFSLFVAASCARLGHFSFSCGLFRDQHSQRGNRLGELTHHRQRSGFPMRVHIPVTTRQLSGAQAGGYREGNSGNLIRSGHSATSSKQIPLASRKQPQMQITPQSV
jgi:hypothetical protein